MWLWWPTVLCEFGNIFKVIQHNFTLLPTSLRLPVDAEVELELVCCKGKKISRSATSTSQYQYIFLTGHIFLTVVLASISLLQQETFPTLT